MTAPHDHAQHRDVHPTGSATGHEPVRLDKHPVSPSSSHGGHGGHGWMMIACCIPMLVIAVVLVATGVAGPGFIVVALACTAMMALMMGGMDKA